MQPSALIVFPALYTYTQLQRPSSKASSCLNLYYERGYCLVGFLSLIGDGIHDAFFTADNLFEGLPSPVSNDGSGSGGPAVIGLKHIR